MDKTHEEKKILLLEQLLDDQTLRSAQIEQHLETLLSYARNRENDLHNIKTTLGFCACMLLGILISISVGWFWQ